MGVLMSSLLASKPLAASASLRPASSSALPRNSPRRRSRCLVRTHDSDTVASDGDPKPQNGNLPKNRRDILLEYVRNVQPYFMELFMKRSPQQVAENLAQLMYSVMMTGYMFGNAQY